MTCRKRIHKALALLLVGGVVIAPCFAASPCVAAVSPVIRLGAVRNDTGDPDLEWFAEALVFSLRWHLEPAAVLQPAGPGAAKGGEERTLSARYLRQGAAMTVILSLQGPGKGSTERLLKGDVSDPAAVLAGLGSALGELFPTTVKAGLRTGVPTAKSGALKEFAMAEGSDDLSARATRYRNALALDPDFHEARWRLGEVAYLGGDYREALTRFGEYRDRVPASGPVHNNLGMCLQKLGRGGEALAEFHRAVELDSQGLEARYNLARALTSLGRLAEAEAEYQAVLALQPKEERAVMELSFIRERRGDHAGALEILGRLPGGAGKASAEYFYNMGLRAWETGDGAGARSGFRLALAMDPGDYFARLASGVVRYQEGDFNGAARELEEAARLRQDDPDLYRYLGLARQGLGQTVPAADDFRRSAELLANQSSAAELRRLLAGGSPEAPAASTPGPAADAARGATAREEKRDEGRPAETGAEGQRPGDDPEAARSRAAALESGNAALRQAVAAAEAQVKVRDERLRDLESRLAAKEETVAALRQDQTERDTARGREQGARESETAVLRKQLAQRDAQLGSLQQEMARRDAAIAALKKDSADQSARSASLRSELQGKKKRVDELESNLQTARRKEEVRREPAPRKPAGDDRDKEYEKTLRATLYGAAVYRHNQGDEEAAAKSLEQLLKLQPEDADAWFLLGAVNTARRDYSRARDAYDKAWRLYRRPVSTR